MALDPIKVAGAVSISLGAAYVVADVIARGVRTALRAIIQDPQLEALFVDRPRRVVRWVIFLIAAAALLFPALSFVGVRTAFGGSPEALARWTFDAGLRIAVIAVAAYLAIRIGSAATRRLEGEMSAGTGLDVIERAKRARTLGRLTQSTLTVTITVIAGLMILRELDVDITPVLTGAGIVGIGVGFGAQTLVRDVISGFFLILEDQVRVGDVAIVNGQSGLVEAVNLRTIVLRDDEGTVHVFPNGEVNTLANRSKDFSYFVIRIPLPLEVDPIAAGDAIRDASATLLTDDEFRPHILEPFELQGMSSLEAGQYILQGRIKTVPLKQWLVGRELLARIADTLKQRDIDLPRPTMHVYVERPISLNQLPPDRNL